MKRIGFAAILLLGITFASCISEDSEVQIDGPHTNSPTNGGGQEEDDPIPPDEKTP